MSSTCKQNGNCFNKDTDVCEDCLEFEKLWSSTAGKVTAYECVISHLEKEAADAFIHHRDDLAKCLRVLATKMRTEFLTPETQKLQAFINKSK